MILGVAIRFVLHRMIDRLVSKAEVGVLPDRVGRLSRGQGKSKAAKPGGADHRDVVVATRRVQRAKTMGSLLKSMITGIIVAIVTTMILAELSASTSLRSSPAPASSAWRSGFGAQSLVSDFLSGIFMIFEDQYGVGDVVDLGEAIGTVEAVSLRVTRLRDINGTVWYVRNGEIMPRRQHEPELGAHRARHQRRLPRGPGEGAPRAPGGRPRPVGRRGLQGPRSSRSPRSGASRRSASTA